jgi:hypothetical protein
MKELMAILEILSLLTREKQYTKEHWEGLKNLYSKKLKNFS